MQASRWSMGRWNCSAWSTPPQWPTGRPCYGCSRAVAVTALVFVSFLLCGMYMRYHQRGPLTSVTRLMVLLLLADRDRRGWRAGRRLTPGVANWSPCCCSP